MLCLPTSQGTIPSDMLRACLRHRHADGRVVSVATSTSSKATHLRKPLVRVEQVMAAGQLEIRTKTHKPPDVRAGRRLAIVGTLALSDMTVPVAEPSIPPGEPGLHPRSQTVRRAATTSALPAAHVLHLVVEGRWREARPCVSDLLCQQTGHDLKTTLTHYAQFIPKDDDGDRIERAFRGISRGTN